MMGTARLVLVRHPKPLHLQENFKSLIRNASVPHIVEISTRRRLISAYIRPYIHKNWYWSLISPGVRRVRAFVISGISNATLGTLVLVLYLRSIYPRLCDLMVHLLSTLRFNDCRSLDWTGFKIEALKNSTLLSSIYFNLCKACQVKAMASIPPSAFSAGRIRETQRNMKLTNVKTAKDPNAKIFNTSFLELSPLKYNSKLMNSIWGLYNRYSPHNVKNVNDGRAFGGELQQSAGNSSKTEPMITMPSPKLDKVWAAINVSQSH